MDRSGPVGILPLLGGLMVYNVGMISIGGDFYFSNTGCVEPGGASYLDFLDACASHCHLSLLSSGRAAYANVWLNLKKRRPSLRRVLAPSYLCYSMLTPLTRMGAEVSFYAVNPDLTIDADDMLRAAAAGAATAAAAPAAVAGDDLLVLVCNYFGFPEQPEVLEAAAQLRMAGAAVMYDATHNALCAPPTAGTKARTAADTQGEAVTSISRGSAFDVCVMSLRKSLPVVDGAVVLWMDGSVPAIEPGEWKHDAFYSARAQAMLLKAAHVSDGFGRPADYAMLFAQAEVALDRTFSPMGAMSPVSRSILRRIDVELTRRARRANYVALIDNLRAGKPGVSLHLIRPELPPDAVPLGCPVLVDERDKAVARLASMGVQAEVYWDLPPEVPAEAFPVSASLARRILMLPCDQRYSSDDMATVARALRA